MKSPSQLTLSDRWALSENCHVVVKSLSTDLTLPQGWPGLIRSGLLYGQR
jgi:hypothetical protein